MKADEEKIKIVIGRTLAIAFEDEPQTKVLAKVDTGAYLAAIWASDIHEKSGKLYYKLFGEGSSHYTGNEHSADDYYMTKVENSFGHSETRFVVKLTIKPKVYDRGYETIRFSLCDRSMKRYPILLGRDYLKGRYLVDVRLNDDDNIRDDEEKEMLKIDEE